jgi:hypothetical protein
MSDKTEGLLQTAAKVIGGAVGTVAAVAGVKTKADKASGRFPKKNKARLPRRQKKMLARKHNKA